MSPKRQLIPDEPITASELISEDIVLKALLYIDANSPTKNVPANKLRDWYYLKLGLTRLFLVCYDVIKTYDHNNDDVRIRDNPAYHIMADARDYGRYYGGEGNAALEERWLFSSAQEFLTIIFREPTENREQTLETLLSDIITSFVRVTQQ